jgi:hypothetical protein
MADSFPGLVGRNTALNPAHEIGFDPAEIAGKQMTRLLKGGRRAAPEADRHIPGGPVCIQQPPFFRILRALLIVP